MARTRPDGDVDNFPGPLAPHPGRCLDVAGPCDAGRVTSGARRAHRPWGVLLPGLALALLAAGCTSVLDRPALPTPGAAGAGTGTAAPTTSVSITPVTPDGLLTGPGVTDGTIDLGVLADPARDGGFTDGVRLWQRAVNSSGGLCGRSIGIRAAGDDGIPADAAAAYRAVGTSVLGLLMLASGPDAASGAGPSSGTGAAPATDPAPTASPTGTTGAAGSAPAPTSAETETGTGAADGTGTLAASIAADQIPTLMPTGSSAQLGPTRPIVVGATADILAVNGLQELLRTGALAAGDTVGLLSDGSATARNVEQGARWWARENGLELTIRDAGEAAAGWPEVQAVVAPVAPSTVATVLTAGPAVPVLTLADGFDPGSWPADAVTAAGQRLFVATSAPAFGSDYPAAVTVSSLAAAIGPEDAGTVGARTLDGYATGAAWGRLLTQACAERTLTREGVWTAAGTVGPAPSTSLFGASDPALPVQSALPATRSSSLSRADPGAPTGLRSVTTLDEAPGLEDYRP